MDKVHAYIDEERESYNNMSRRELLERGHWLAARFFGKQLRFRFAWGRFGVPRFIWDMPYFFMNEGWKVKVIAAAGFGTELFTAVVLLAAWREFGLWYAEIGRAHV